MSLFSLFRNSVGKGYEESRNEQFCSRCFPYKRGDYLVCLFIDEKTEAMSS